MCFHLSKPMFRDALHVKRGPDQAAVTSVTLTVNRDALDIYILEHFHRKDYSICGSLLL